MTPNSEVLDLSNFKISSLQGERLVLSDILRKIKGWIVKNDPIFLKDAANNVLLNKITYFSSLNLGLDVTKGWYLYGPCIDYYRVPTVAEQEFQAIKPTDKFEDGIASECADHISSFKDHRVEHDFYGYLNYVYRNKTDEYSDYIKDLYVSKNDLFWKLSELVKNKGMDESDIVSAFDYFNQSFTSDKYLDFVGLDETSTDNLLDCSLTLMDFIVQLLPELNNKSVARQISDETNKFNQTVFKTLSDKNYYTTLKSFSEGVRRDRRNNIWHEYNYNYKETRKSKERLKFLIYSKEMRDIDALKS